MCHIQSFLGHFHYLPGFSNINYSVISCVSLSLLLRLLLQTNLDRAHSCQHEPLSHTRKNLQNKREFTSKPAPSRKHFSAHLTRKGVFSFFGNTWALLLSKAFNTLIVEYFISPLCNIFHTLGAHLAHERQQSPAVPVLAPAPLPVLLQNNSTLHRDTNLDPRIDSAEFTLPGLHHEAFFLFSKAALLRFNVTQVHRVSSGVYHEASVLFSFIPVLELSRIQSQGVKPAEK